MSTVLRQLSLQLGRGEADAVARGLSAELQMPALFDRISRVYLDRPRHPLLARARRTPEDAVIARTTASTSLGDRVLIEVLTRSGAAVEVDALEIPRRALR